MKSTMPSNADLTASLAALNLLVIVSFIAPTLANINVAAFFNVWVASLHVLFHVCVTLALIALTTVPTVDLIEFKMLKRVFLIAFQTVDVTALIAFQVTLIMLLIMLNAPFVTALIASHVPVTISLIRLHAPSAISFIPCQASSQSPVKTPTRKSIIPLSVSATSPIILINDFITFIAVVPTTSIIFATTGSKFAIIQLIKGTNTDSHRSFRESMSLPRNASIFRIASPNGPSNSPLICSASPCSTGRMYVLYPVIRVSSILDSPSAIESKNGFTCSSYNLDTASLRFWTTVKTPLVTVSITPRLPSIADFKMSLLSIKGCAIMLRISLPSFAAVSVTVIPISAKIPIKSAVICCAVSPPKTEKTSAKATARFPAICEISAPMLNISIR